MTDPKPKPDDAKTDEAPKPVSFWLGDEPICVPGHGLGEPGREYEVAPEIAKELADAGAGSTTPPKPKPKEA